MNEQNIEQMGKQPQKKKPSNMKIKKLQQIQNNRYLNQNIYQLFVIGRYDQCLQLIQKCQPDEYKLYIKAMVFKNLFKLEQSLTLLMECQAMNKLNFHYLKNIAKNLYLSPYLVIYSASTSPVFKLPRKPINLMLLIIRFSTSSPKLQSP